MLPLEDAFVICHLFPGLMSPQQGLISLQVDAGSIYKMSNSEFTGEEEGPWPSRPSDSMLALAHLPSQFRQSVLTSGQTTQLPLWKEAMDHWLDNHRVFEFWASTWKTLEQSRPYPHGCCKLSWNSFRSWS